MADSTSAPASIFGSPDYDASFFPYFPSPSLLNVWSISSSGWNVVDRWVALFMARLSGIGLSDGLLTRGPRLIVTTGANRTFLAAILIIWSFRYRETVVQRPLTTELAYSVTSKGNRSVGFSSD
jgi:hypothetical protein